MVRILPPLCNLAEAARIGKIELHQMANLSIRTIRIPTISKMMVKVNKLKLTLEVQ